MKNKNIQLSELNVKIPMLLSWEAGSADGPPLKNEPILEFKDSLIDLGRFYSYLQSLPVKERARKLRKQKKLFANIVPP